MADQILPVQQPCSPTVIQKRDINIPGDGHTIVANANNVNTTMFVMQGAVQVGMPGLFDGTFRPDYECYNLFVTDTDSFGDGWFYIRKEDALTESTPPDIFSECCSLSEPAILRIMSHPAIFASRNQLQGRKTRDDHYAYYGYVTSVDVLEDLIKVGCMLMNKVLQNTLIDLSDDLGIEYAPYFCEFDRPHWAIKRVNLVDVLREAGYRVFTM